MIVRRLVVKQYYSKAALDKTPDPIAEFRAWVEFRTVTIEQFDAVRALDTLAERFGTRKAVAAALGVTPRSERRYRRGERVPAQRVVERLKRFFPRLQSRKQLTKKIVQAVKGASFEELRDAVRRMEWIFKSIFHAKRSGTVIGEITGEEEEQIDSDEAPDVGSGIQRYARFYSVNGRVKVEYSERAIRGFERARGREYSKYLDEKGRN